jgi:hypothetical protein
LAFTLNQCLFLSMIVSPTNNRLLNLPF